MTIYTCEIYNRQGIRIEPGVALRPLWASTHAMGGPERTEIAAEGTPEQLRQMRRWLDYRIVIVNPLGDPVWWGRVTRPSVRQGGRERGVSLDEVANRVRVLYSLLDGEGNAVDATTEWAEDAYSVSEYGRHELRYSMGEALPEQAERVRNELLKMRKLPRPTSAPGRGDLGATIRAEGVYVTLDREYFANDVGRAIFDVSGNSAQPLGWGMVNDPNLCFADGSLQDLAGRLDGLGDEVQLRVTGTSGNDGLHVCDGSPQGDGQQKYTATTIRFEATDDIKDTAKGLNFIEPGFVFGVSGSTLNDGHHLAETQEDRGYITTENTFRGSEVQDESAGASITLTRGQKIRLSTPTALEGLGLVTVRVAGQQIAYQVQHAGEAFTVGEIWVRVSKVGNPTDNLLATFHSQSGGLPGTQLDGAYVAGTAIFERATWVKFLLTNTISFPPSIPCWIRIERTGPPSPTDYYEVALEENEDGGGTLKLFDGVTWVDRTTSAHLPYQIWGSVATTAQIAAIQEAAPGRTTGSSVRPASEIATRQYREGRNTALDEIEKLLEMGTASGQRLRAYCDLDERLIVVEEADPALPTLRAEEDGSLTRWGRPLKPGEMPAGEWAEDGDAAGAPELADSTMLYIERCEFDFETGNLRWYERGAIQPLEFDRLMQG